LNNSESSITIIDSRGKNLSGWPQIGDVKVFLPPAAGDINNDGQIEVIGLSNNTILGGASCIDVWQANGGELSGFPKEISALNFAEHFVRHPLLTDINNDGQLEIVTATDMGRIFAFDANGNVLSGWPKHYPGTDAKIAVIDLNAEKRLIVGEGKTIHLLKADGSEEAGWPKNIDNNISNLAAGDLENNGSQQIVATGDFSAGVKKVWVFNSDGNVKAGWPTTINSAGNSNPSLSLGDVDNDGQVEIIFSAVDYDDSASSCNSSNIYVYDSIGNLKTGWPKEIKNDCSYNDILISDFNGDGSAEILFPTSAKKVFAWNGFGEAVNNYPRYTRGINYASAIFDMDGNGRKELLFATYSPYEPDQQMYAWEDPAVAQPGGGWPMWRHDAMNTGNLNTDTTPPTIAHIPPAQAEVNLPVNIAAQITDNIGVRMARVFYKGSSSSAFQFIQMNNTGGAEWQGAIPAAAVAFEGIQYYIAAQDSDLNPAKTSTYSLSVVDSMAPAIDHTPVTTAAEGLDLNISARIADNSNSIQAPQLFFRISGIDTWQVVDLKNDNNLFSAIIPAAFMTTQGVDYYLQAQDPSDNIADAPAAAPEAYFSINIRVDTAGPSIALDPVSEASAGLALLITADITDDLAGVDSATLTYRHKKKYDWKSVSFKAREGVLYSTYIPSGDMLEGEIEYYATAKDKKANESKTAAYATKVISSVRPSGCGCSI